MKIGAVHDKVHELLDEPDLLTAVNETLAKYNHQAIELGELRSGLHMHFICHAVGGENDVYVSVDGGPEKLVKSVRRRVNKGKISTALVLEV